ncbi:MAG: dTDP-4-dehydrorhamnose 3,5-epimerase family protein [Chloroflexi bacterium]|nr:dTDP-4-dehydrorhamnose 3,5-epimerase family protein [Chloroflexota bacterium]
MTGPTALALPAGVVLRPLQNHGDERGEFVELYRGEWGTGVAAVQWSLSRSLPGTLRGVDVHVQHDEYFVLIRGRASVGLRDLRNGSATEGLTTLIELRAAPLAALTIPRGVAHGFYFHEPSDLVHGSSQYWDPSDYLSCRWTDPALGIPWPAATAAVSPRQAAAPTLSELLAKLEPYQPIG